MFTPKYYYTPLRLGKSIDFSPVIPSEFEGYFGVAEKVSRYVFTGSEINFIFQDNVAVHTKRLVNYVRNIDLPDFLDRARIERMLWLHDLPEAIVNEERGADYVTHEKNVDQTLGELQDSIEEKAARDMFDASDLELFSEMEQAKGKIKKADWSDVQEHRNGIFAKMLDWIESRNKFTYITTEWIAHSDYALNPILPPIGTMQLCLRDSYQVWMRDFREIPDALFRDFMLEFIHDEMYDFHRLRWSPVMQNTPGEVQALYADFVKYGKK